MDFDDYLVLERPDFEIERVAMSARAQLNYYFVGNTLDTFGLFEAASKMLGRKIQVVPQSADLMGRANAYVSRERDKVFVRSCVIENASKGDPSSIFVVVHELGHLVLEHPGPPLYRMADGNRKLKFGTANARAEYQANYFTRAFLMTLDEVARFPDPHALAEACIVPDAQAAIRLTEAEQIRRKFPQLLRERGSILQPDQELRKPHLKLWEQCSTCENEDPKEFRSFDNRWAIRLSRFQTTQVGGWRVVDGQIVPWEKERSE